MTGGRQALDRTLGSARLLAAVVVIVLLSSAAPASAHPLSTSAVLLDVGTRSVTATVELPLDELSIARDESLTASSVVEARTLTDLRSYLQADLTATDGSGQTWSTTVTGGRVEKVDGVDNLVLDATLTPGSGRVGNFVLHDDAIIDRLIAHRVFVSGRYGHTGAYTTLAMLSWQSQTVSVASAVTEPAVPGGRGFVAAVRLGVHHIATGSDHLLFLIMLLLPAPLIAIRGRWRPRTGAGLADVGRSSLRVLHVTAAFAVGHSCTLALGALGWVHLPTHVVESGIALSVLVSAVHAMRPLVRRGEVLIAGGFGLLHGLAFAAVLGSLDLSRADLVTTLLGFNLGIELTQLLVVALVMPSLLLLSRTPVYPVLRTGVAALGALLAAGWFADRVSLVAANPLEPFAEMLVAHPLALAGGLEVLALACTGIRHVRRPRRTPVSAPAHLVPDTISSRPRQKRLRCSRVLLNRYARPATSAAPCTRGDRSDRERGGQRQLHRTTMRGRRKPDWAQRLHPPRTAAPECCGSVRHCADAGRCSEVVSRPGPPRIRDRAVTETRGTPSS